ncbi:MAG: TonB-dependent receptor [Balneolales bacterium]|nr:TonB-dependent receptor [Balneolales bacterium]
MMHRVILLGLMLFCLLSGSAFAQTYTLSGTVTDSRSGEALIGVNIFVTELSGGATTDLEGRYEIPLSPGTYSLVVTYIGYRTQTTEVTITDSNVSRNFSLVLDRVDLDQVVVVGFGTRSLRDVTGSIATVSGEMIQNTPVNTLESAIQGRVAGIFIERETGKLGGATQVRIRGGSSVTGGNQPLYVIDGIPVTMDDLSANASATNPLSDINQNDIESIEILRDASAAAIYGSRASNGVILITTKRGREGRTQFSYSFQAGISEPTNQRGFLNTAEFFELYEEAARNRAIDDGVDPEVWLGLFYEDMEWLSAGEFRQFADGSWGWRDGVVDTNWEKEAFQSAGMFRHELSARGGNDRTRFFVSGSYSDETGILINNDFERIGARINLDHTVNDRFLIGMNLSTNRSVMNRLSSDNAFATPMQLVAQPPVTPIFDPRTCFDENEETIPGCTPILSGDFTEYYNGLLHRDYADYVTTVFRTIGGAYGDFRVSPNLNIRTEYGIDLLTQNEDQYYGALTARGVGGNEGQGLGFSRWVQIQNWTSQTFATYQNTFQDVHDLEVVGGFSAQRVTDTRSFVEGRGFPNDNFRRIASAAEIIGGSSSGSDYSFISYFSRLNYKYDEKYLLSLSGRVDGSSRFGVDNRYGFFPAASVGWIISEESFMRNATYFDLLKLRASYGITGNAAIGNFASRGLFSGTSYAGFSGINPSQSPNPDLRWEQTAQFDLGIDFGILGNRIRVEADYYVKNTRDLLLNVNVPATTGFTSQLRNVGKLENRGFEFTVNTFNLTGELQWTSNFNFTTNNNKITDLDGQVITAGFINRAIEGQPIGVFFTREYAGVDPETGSALYFVNSGDNPRETTTNPANATEVIVGDPNPDFIGGFGNNFFYKGIELNVLFQFVYGNDVYMPSGRFMSANAWFYDNQTKDQLKRWRQPGDVTDVPRPVLFRANGTAPSSRYIEDGSYLRLKNVTLAYNLPSAFLSNYGLDRMRVYFTGVNLLTFTKYPGWDPEVNTDFLAGNISQGTEFYSAPQARSFTFGIDIGF